MQCPQCRAENDAGLRFCESCGAQLARLCPSCGHDLKPQAPFCGGCGERLLLAALPLVLFVEDLHWCDVSTLELLGHLIAQSPTTRVLLLATARAAFHAG